jgi:Aromatic-ring-opening dioxygenase LigAB, LigA subunit
LSKYATNRVLWEAAADPVLAQQVLEDPDAALAGRDLTDEERAALGKADIRGLFQLGVHPFLLYNFALRLAGGFSMPFVQSYLAQLEGLELGDLDT